MADRGKRKPGAGGKRRSVHSRRGSDRDRRLIVSHGAQHKPNEVRPQPAPIEVLYTVGFERRPLQKLLQLLVDNGVGLLADLRADATVPVPGFRKDRDLALLLKELAAIDYRHEEILVPQRELLERYRRDGNWARFEAGYLDLLRAQRVEEKLPREAYAAARPCFLGANRSPERDYRRLAAEHLADKWKIGRIEHL